MCTGKASLHSCISSMANGVAERGSDWTERRWESNPTFFVTGTGALFFSRRRLYNHRWPHRRRCC